MALLVCSKFLEAWQGPQTGRLFTQEHPAHCRFTTNVWGMTEVQVAGVGESQDLFVEELLFHRLSHQSVDQHG